MQIDHAMTRFYALVKTALTGVSGIKVAWGRYQGNLTFPWVSLQAIVGPNTSRIQRAESIRQSVVVTVLDGDEDDPVAFWCGGRYLTTEHTGDADTTAEALEALLPPHWTVDRTDAVLTITGADVYGGIAYFGTEVVNTPTGDPIWVNCYRRDVTIQVDVWTSSDRNGRPARWDPTGCDVLALRIRDALWDVTPDPWEVFVRPSGVIRPTSESYPDGREYQRASFDAMVSWLDILAENQYGTETGALEEAAGEIRTSSDGTSYVIEDFTIDETLDP